MDPSTLLTFATFIPTAAQGVDKLEDFLTNFRGIDSLDDYQSRFATSFEKSLKEELDEEVAVDGIVSKFESNRKQILASFGDKHVVDASTVIETVTEKVTVLVLEEIDSKNTDRSDIEPAVENAYYATLDDLSNEIKEGDRARLNNELNREIQKTLTEIQETLAAQPDSQQAETGVDHGYDPFRIEREEAEMESLVTEELAQSLHREGDFHDPPGFDRCADDPFVLIYGRKGSGKTRALTESVRQLIDRQPFDAVIFVQQGFRTFDQLDAVLQRQYNGDVLVIWDDAHDTRHRDVIVDTVRTVADHLDRCGGHDLWLRMTARREDLDGVLKASQRSDSEQVQIYNADITPADSELTTLPVDTDEHFDRNTVSKLVTEALSAHELSDPNGLTEEFVAAVLAYEPTPAYIDAAIRAIAGSTDELQPHHIDSLPSSTLESWTQAYAELRNSSQYGASRQAILKAVALLDWLDADDFAIPLIRSISRTAFDSTEDFQADLAYLESRGWLSIEDSTDQVEIHDIRLEAIDTPTTVPSVIDGLSSVLRGLTDTEQTVAGEVDDGYASTLNSAFAKRLQTHGKTELAEKHFKLAIRTGEPTPDIHNGYAEFLEAQNRPEEARLQQQTAKSMRTNRSGNSVALRKLQEQIEEGLSTWSNEEVDRSGYTEKTESMLESNANPSRADWTQEAYSKTDQRNTPPEPPSKKERAKSIAETERRLHEQTLESIMEALQSEAFETAAPEAGLFRKLCRTEFNVPETLLENLQAPNPPAGVITDIIELDDLTSTGSQRAEGSLPRVEQSRKTTYREVVTEQFVTPGELEPTDAESRLRILIEIDSGRNKWLVFVDPAETATIINTTVEKAVTIMRDAMGTEPIIEQLEAKLIGNHCYVRAGPGAAKDELLLKEEKAFETPPLVDATKVYPQPATALPASDSTINTRAMATEIQAATKPVRQAGSLDTGDGVVLPTGIRAPRVCLCGNITEGQTVDDDFWWTKLQDVFGGSILAYTEAYKHQGQQAVSTAHPVMVIGTPTPIETDSGDIEVTLKLETIMNVDLETCLLTAIEAGTQTLDRIERFDADAGLSEVSRQKYDIETVVDLDQYQDTASRYTELF